MMRVLTHVFCAAVFVQGVTTGHAADCPVDFDAKGVVAIYEARSTTQLMAAYRSYRYPDSIAAVVYAVRLVDLSHTSSDEAVLKAVPGNPIEFWAVYHFPDNPMIATKYPELANVFDRYVGILATIVSRKSATDEQLRRYLLLSVFADGSVAEDLATLNVRVANANRDRFRRVVKRLTPEERRRICGSERPCAMPSAP